MWVTEEQRLILCKADRRIESPASTSQVCATAKHIRKQSVCEGSFTIMAVSLMQHRQDLTSDPSKGRETEKKDLRSLVISSD